MPPEDPIPISQARSHPRNLEEAKKTKVPSCDPPEARQVITPILQELQSARKRPLFGFVSKHVDEDVCGEVYRWRSELKDTGKDDLDILIHSPGGDLNACYQIARLFSRYANSWEALVPACAASGATLVCLGSSNIVLSEIAQLSPIDPQVISKRHEKFFASERQSPLEAFQAVRYLRQFALASLDASMVFLLDHGVAPKPALETASNFGFHLAQPVLGKIDPYDLGAFALDSTLSIHYCQRVGNPADTSKKTQRSVPYRDLVEKYPAHEFVIDLEEARILRFSVSEPTPQIDDLFDRMRPHLDEVQQFIGFVPRSEANDD